MWCHTQDLNFYTIRYTLPSTLNLHTPQTLPPIILKCIDRRRRVWWECMMTPPALPFHTHTSFTVGGRLQFQSWHGNRQPGLILFLTAHTFTRRTIETRVRPWRNLQSILTMSSHRYTHNRPFSKLAYNLISQCYEQCSPGPDRLGESLVRY